MCVVIPQFYKVVEFCCFPSIKKIYISKVYFLQRLGTILEESAPSFRTVKIWVVFKSGGASTQNAESSGELKSPTT